MEYGKLKAAIPDPGILKQGDGWQAGEVKPRLGGEHEVRPENVQKIILEENPEMMQALGEAQGRAQEELIKLSGQQMPKIAIGDKVRARGLRNLGTIIGLNADGTYGTAKLQRHGFRGWTPRILFTRNSAWIRLTPK